MALSGARYPHGLVAQGISAELIAARWKLDRTSLDEYAARSHERAAATAASSGFDSEILSISMPHPDGEPFTAETDAPPRCSS